MSTKSGNDDWNRTVFSSRRKTGREGTFQTCCGTAFYARTAATGNDRSQRVERLKTCFLKYLLVIFIISPRCVDEGPPVGRSEHLAYPVDPCCRMPRIISDRENMYLVAVTRRA